MKMKGAFSGLAALLLASATHAVTPTAPISLWRLDCGKISAFDLDEFSDTRAYVGQHKDLTASCYLIRHGDTYMLWDTGLPRAMLNHSPPPPVQKMTVVAKPSSTPNTRPLHVW